MKKILISMLLLLVLSLGVASAVPLDASSPIEVVFTDISETVNPGSTASFTVSLTNTDLLESYDMTFTSTDLEETEGVESILAPTITGITIAADSTQDVTFTIDVPAGTLADTYIGELTIYDGTYSNDYIYNIIVNPLEAYTISISEINMDMQSDDTDSTTFTITNNGNTDLVISSTDITFLSEDGDIDFIEDADGDQITVDISYTAKTLLYGQSMTVTVNFDVDKDVDINGDYDGTIEFADFTETIAVNVNVNAAICEDGLQGSDFDITIDEPDSGDDYTPGETIIVDVEVKNNANDDLDIVVEVILYNRDTGDIEERVTEDFQIDEDETQDFSVELKIPTDIDESDSYYLYVQVHEDGNEDDSCDYTYVSIDIKRSDEDAAITSATLTPTVGLVCGEDYRLSLTVESLGTDGLNDMYVEVVDGDLGVSESSARFDLGDYNDNDNDYRITFDLTLPEDLEKGSYYLEAILYDENGNSMDSELILVELEACSVSTTTTEGDDTLKVTVSEEYEVNGEEMTVALIIENNGDSTKIISVDIEDVSWADLDSAEYLDTLSSGDVIHAYLYFTLDMTTEDKHDIEITVSDDQGNEVSKIITVDFGVTEIAEEDKFFSGVTGWFAAKSASQKTFWVIADLILVILSLVFLRMLFSKR
ncbi:MAG: putative S-layer protein [Nanoarchaeota archaeon]|nr:putative S-layer protein [Nanoarchaeota archaeon]